jgi:hypothetical protein
MAVLTDLKFSEVAAKLPVGAVTFSTDTVIFNSKLITGDSKAALTDEGFAELLYKLQVAAEQAQTDANDALAPTDTPLAAFGNIAIGVPLADSTVPVSVINSYVIPLAVNSVVGAN